MNVTQFTRMATMGNSTDSRTAPADLPGPTKQSIASAKWQQQQDRAAVTQQTGVTFVGDAMQPPLKHLVAIACTMPGCLTTVVGGSEGEAIEKVEAHLMRRHGVQAPKEVA